LRGVSSRRTDIAAAVCCSRWFGSVHCQSQDVRMTGAKGLLRFRHRPTKPDRPRAMATAPHRGIGCFAEKLPSPRALHPMPDEVALADPSALEPQQPVIRDYWA